MIELNGVKIEPTIFPDKTSQVWKIEESAFKPLNSIIWYFENESEVMHLCQLKFLLDTKGLPANLYLPYLPYGRQDKKISNESTFALRVFADIIKSLQFEEISVLDAHSELFLELTGAENVYPLVEIETAIDAFKPDVIGYPDRGAARRYNYKIYMDQVIGEKSRDPLTGRIDYDGVHVEHGVDIKNKRVLTVDDLCDGGMTFILFTKLLKERGVGEVGLYTTHGIYSKGLDVLREAGITRIFNKEGEV